MNYLVIKYLLSALLVVVVSEAGKRLPTFGALIASLPWISVMAIVWMYREGTNEQIIATHVEATFWYVLPSLPMFLGLPYLLRHGVGFYPGLAIVCVVTMLLYVGVSYLAPYFGVDL